MTRVGALWIGGLESYMDESFLSGAMMALGQDGIVSIKVMNNRCTGQPAGYGFINFESDQKAIYVMHRLGGKIIPNSSPPVRFKLNHNSTRLQPGELDTSVWVGDLSPDVDDFLLYQFFTTRYSSVRCAKVVLDEAGLSKGYGFVRFGLETEQQHALANMTGEIGLGSKPIKVSMANQKNRRIPENNTPWGAPGVEVGPPGGGNTPNDPWPPNSNTNSNLPPATHTPDYNLYQYYQYAQQLNQQQYAAAWNAWQQQQQQ
ncbi:tRNA selenocysteine 1associated protein 1like [Caligus rogercresseyi]|uniref:tRNA selenocysteine-associated protein 1 n=1 Tax=Caligus rogercresseyi TaxID=217165 RepID=A0A7T8KGQ8_CALRO|nr:tRNA selenocysteine 1associated protein 1like [Caligus rogercresseyi]